MALGLELNKFFFFFPAVLSLLAWAFSSAAIGDASLSCAQASRCGGFSCCRARAPGHTGFSGWDSQALEHMLSSCGAWA